VDYSNYGFVLLGAIIENVTGRDYYEVVREKVFVPAGMDSTGAEPESADVPLRATAYHSKGGAWVDAASTLPWRGTAAGGGYTTVGDLLKFAQALQAGKLLSPAMLAQATSPQMQEGWYGFGFITVGEGPLRRYGHGGDADGMNADFRVFPESGWVLISLANIDPPAAYRLGRWFEPRMPIDAAPAPATR
jgi:CubicO group peptidase (beta-lactamase class C family)